MEPLLLVKNENEIQKKLIYGIIMKNSFLFWDHQFIPAFWVNSMNNNCNIYVTLYDKWLLA